MRRFLNYVVLFIGLLLSSVGSWANSIALSIDGHMLPYSVFSLFKGPGQLVRLELLGSEVDQIQLYLDGKAHGSREGSAWVMNAPLQPGLYSLQLNHARSNERKRINLFVGHPVSEISGGHLNGYKIGTAPQPNPRYPRRYAKPEYWYEVTEQNIDTRLSPHFTLRQFVCKQVSGYPKYVVLQPSLLVLLERLLAEVQSSGVAIETFGVISGYRTPYYNKRIGNVPTSRHVYGDAFDFYIDADGDGLMDDLNGDGERNRADVDWLFLLIERFSQKSENALLTGGIGRYYRASHHGGFVHVDTRGYRARW
ncbi:MAG: D-Ala-D-Ala carboxypeptidase family metallohydrolase [Halioglobus sp.]